ncbi:MAG: kinase [Myxococcota bacterium]
MVGVHGPQGSGKSTLCAWLVGALAARDLRATTVSIDDFYLTHAEQRRLAAQHPGDPYLEHRGYPGTHDVALGERVLAALASPVDGEVALPVYDKSAHGGRGDRLPEAVWRRVATPLDLVLVEGWMLGFAPVAEAALPDARLAFPNARLADYAAWRRRLDVLVSLEVGREHLDWIVAWRVDAERARRAAGAAGLSDAEAHDYIARFLPAYRTWSVGGVGEAEAGGADVVRIALGPDRAPRGDAS